MNEVLRVQRCHRTGRPIAAYLRCRDRGEGESKKAVTTLDAAVPLGMGLGKGEVFLDQDLNGHVMGVEFLGPPELLEGLADLLDRAGRAEG